MRQRWRRAKEKIGFEKKESSFDCLEKDVYGPENHKNSVKDL